MICHPTDAEITTYSSCNIRGDIIATVDAGGNIKGIYMTGPFGEIPENTLGQTNPDNSTGETAFAYVGKHRKVTETSLAIGIIQMGARVYVPELGRFLQIDSVEGGTLNMYVYAMNPVSQFDLSGKIAFVLTAGAVGWLLSGLAALAGLWFMTTPVYRDATERLAMRITEAIRSRETQAKVKTTEVPRGCPTYMPAIGYPGTTLVPLSDPPFPPKKYGYRYSGYGPKSRSSSWRFSDIWERAVDERIRRYPFRCRWVWVGKIQHTLPCSWFRSTLFIE